MSQVEQARATIEDLYREPGKAELINGRIVREMATGRRPNHVAGRIYASLLEYSEDHPGEAYTDNMGFVVSELVSGRESFSPDASYYQGPFGPNDMRFVDGPPTFAVEVRSENDYGPAADREIARKREDYFAAGTLVVWDVDPIAREIRAYSAAAPDRPRLFRPGDVADAEPAVPDWRMEAERILR